MADLGFIVWEDGQRGRNDAVRVEATSASEAARHWYRWWRKQRCDTTAPVNVIVEELRSGLRARWSLHVVDPIVATLQGEVPRG